ncbi:SDR family oxidoreductase [Bradyrhizobium sp. U87765 SZCCT0131]|uniref:SDR family NAD(P)-dependent oxidoreductase n=1 Tax=unclassified Bradyrhizobium TaxID=2631580 RepID=UPI001BAA77E4|nr:MULTISPECIES: SDR family NAD(P)-dependent oxidoreductase [unclassified Bradyrhizobium]MBR1219790.1 SDR family oxidoreductase [Bradyrhizobium sp. U87765 SZCCT0131]MBR1262441.1 SDR family oxidoreductase [Bradyrhizobium sp. U87765 SZCCT0134]MBR1308376.1 SDR family oxidoreductase [Bradyrhizobium sp. U87765 SZCCT0110]MBR1318223.1 SDR family oxidoreductase [Bradyrhizobium sp. U87765 SZCCT0109]MBR1351926.1 SDR family oxidoreductase [Bradyrhizobium sp. U87765 SZCCT0048]
MLLSDKVAVVTGGGNVKGIGFAAARMFAANGARVAILDNDGAALADAAKLVGPAALPLQVDVASRAACHDAAERVRAQWGRVDVLLNNAGVVQKRRVAEVSDDDYTFVLDVNLRGALHVTQELLPLMARGSSIVFIGSIAAQRGGGLLGGPHYAASKGGILALAKSLARELGPAGIRVNAVNPGVIHTAMTENAYDADLRASVTASIPLGRFGTPDDVAGACLFLASGLSGYITGAEIDVNGGQHIH